MRSPWQLNFSANEAERREGEQEEEEQEEEEQEEEESHLGNFLPLFRTRARTHACAHATCDVRARAAASR